MNSFKSFGSLLVVLLGLFVIGCTEASPDNTASSEHDNSVIARNYNRTLRFPEAPRRVVTMNQNSTEMFLALGLKDRMVGTAFRDNRILKQYRDEYETIPVLSEKYPSLEVLLDVQPDFIYGFKTAFSPPKGPATVQRLAELGITAWVDPMFYGTGPLTLDDVYDEMRTLGRIFRVENRAETLVESLRRDVESVRDRIPADADTVSVAVYDSGKKTMYTSGTSLISDMLGTVGARNVFEDEIDDSWAPVSWEKLVRENPEYIVVMDYGNVSAEDKINFLESKSSLETVRAVSRENYVILPLSTTFVGGRNPDGIRRLARGFYPEQFSE